MLSPHHLIILHLLVTLRTIVKATSIGRHCSQLNHTDKERIPTSSVEREDIRHTFMCCPSQQNHQMTKFDPIYMELCLNFLLIEEEYVVGTILERCSTLKKGSGPPLLQHWKLSLTWAFLLFLFWGVGVGGGRVPNNLLVWTCLFIALPNTHKAFGCLLTNGDLWEDEVKLNL